MTNIVKNNSEGNRYNYASLSDIANQGYELPKMTTGTDNGKDYVYYYDKELGWLRGAEIVVPSPILNREGKPSMNEAQLYGSAITYARRYTTLMALQLACEDDKELESMPDDIKATDKQLNYITKLYDATNIAKILQYYKAESLNELTVQQATEVIQQAKRRNDIAKHAKPDQ